MVRPATGSGVGEGGTSVGGIGVEVSTGGVGVGLRWRGVGEEGSCVGDELTWRGAEAAVATTEVGWIDAAGWAGELQAISVNSRLPARNRRVFRNQRSMLCCTPKIYL